MIANQPVAGLRGPAPRTLGGVGTRAGIWQRLAAWWSRACRCTALDRAVEARVRRYLGHRRPEPGDVVIVDMIAAEVYRQPL